MFLATASTQALIVEGADVDNAYFYISRDVAIIMEQPINSFQIPEMHLSYCLYHMLLYGAWQDGILRGFMIDKEIKSCGFTVSRFDQRLYFKRNGNGFIFLLLVVDDMAFPSNNQGSMHDFKQYLQQCFDVKFYGKLTNFIG